MYLKRTINGVIFGILVLYALDSSAHEETNTSLSTGGSAPRPARPEFTWDRIPLYMHIRKATSFTDEEIAFLARFPLITFEKANGHEDHGSVEAGTLIAARAVKELNPKATILYYRNVMVHYGGYAANKGLNESPEPCSRIRRDAPNLYAIASRHTTSPTRTCAHGGWKPAVA